ncbi:MAG: DNA repair protein RadC [Paludibacteraceae bacterium]|nr:DNA repair protein RadC [Paludibacteraceae bacterium]
MDKAHPLPITQWSKSDRPREKMALLGLSALSDAELLAILLGTGTRSESAVDLARRLLGTVDNDLGRLGRLSVEDLCRRIRGVGPAKATSIVAAMELARRRRADSVQNDTIQGGAQVAALMTPLLADLPHEEFWVLLLNRANRLISKYRISTGGVHQSVVDPRMVFKHVVQDLASGLILCHNHPSGSLLPSESDRQLTGRLVAGAELLGARVLDHVIVSTDGWFGFADHQLL